MRCSVCFRHNTDTHKEQVCLPGNYTQQCNSSHTRAGLHLASQPWGSLEGEHTCRASQTDCPRRLLRCPEMPANNKVNRHIGTAGVMSGLCDTVVTSCDSYLYQNNTFILVALRCHLHTQTMFMTTYLCNILAFILSQLTYSITEFVFNFKLFS